MVEFVVTLKRRSARRTGAVGMAGRSPAELAVVGENLRQGSADEPFNWEISVWGCEQAQGVAIIERFIRSLENECTRRILIPLRSETQRHELAPYVAWHKRHRPSQALGGSTPRETYDQGLEIGSFVHWTMTRGLEFSE